MPRVSLVAALAAAAVLAAAAPSGAGSSTLTATVGPGFTIRLAQDGKVVSHLQPGRYTLVVADRSPIHDFHLAGPGLDTRLTSVAFVGRKSVHVTLRKGRYRYACDPHRSLMHGAFTVG